MNVGTTNDAYFGYYWTDDSVFTALAATPLNGGPEPGHAALGTHVAIKLLSVEGPTGAKFGFWEAGGQDTSGEGVDGTNLTWSLDVPLQGGTNVIDVSENDGSAGVDPYGQHSWTGLQRHETRLLPCNMARRRERLFPATTGCIGSSFRPRARRSSFG